MRLRLCVFAFLLLAGCSAQDKTAGDFIYRYRLAAENSAKAPVLILLHGYGSDENDLFSLAPRLPFRMNVFSLRAPLSLEQGGYAWFRLDRSDGSQWRYNYGETKRSRAQILAFVGEISKLHGCDTSRVYLLGFSQGAIMSLDIALCEPGLVDGIAALSGRVLPESQQNAIRSTSDLRCFLGHGVNDNVVSFAGSTEAGEVLKARGIDVTFKQYGSAHQITEEELRDLEVWFRDNAR